MYSAAKLNSLGLQAIYPYSLATIKTMNINISVTPAAAFRSFFLFFFFFFF